MKTLKTNYKVATSDITVTVVVGNGQRGNTLVAVGSEELANGPNITNLVIGNGSDVAGKALTLLTTVSQTNTSTPDAVVTYRVRGGAQDRDYQLQEAFADGEVQIQFDGTVDLTA
ncbi:MAG: hypothetical protein DMD65_06815 [Gemmatimonadetes bacterium]|nr:MAG: hypothetical protein DMD65_06815 [Gemmatimonadota bacterium]